MEKLNELQLSLLRRDLENYFFWQLASKRDVLNGNFYSIMAVNLVTESYFNICRMMGQKDLPDNWIEMCAEAQQKADERYAEEQKKGLME